MIYLDNAATTPLDPAVLEAMMPFLTEKFGNPTSLYRPGLEARLAIETARKSVARILHAKPAGIVFTSGGTESTNMAIAAAVRDLNCTRIITSPLEHHAVLHTIDYWKATEKVEVAHVKLLPDGHIDLEDLRNRLAASPKKTLVSLMHANNEIGNLLDIQVVGWLCKEYQAVFHSDTVQTLGHLPLKLNDLDVHFIAGSGHKFHGPKGVGMLYVNPKIKINPLLHGGAQERNMRAGTENVYGIVGFAKALELATDHYEKDSRHIQHIKTYTMGKLTQHIPSTTFNGDAQKKSLYTILSTSFPVKGKSTSLLACLDEHGICASGGSACSAGSGTGSHVLKALQHPKNRTTVRFSFSKYNTREEVDEVIRLIRDFYN